MKPILPYFTIPATVRFGVKTWPSTPHEWLANARTDKQSLKLFDKIFGTPFENFYVAEPMPESFRDALDAPRGPGGKVRMTVDLFARLQEELREAWEQPGPHADLTVGKEGAGFITAPVKTHLVITEKGLEVIAVDVWSYLRLAFAADAAAERLHVCRNENCDTPMRYFREIRRGQVYCSHACAVAVASRNFQRKASAMKKQNRGGAR